MSSLLGCFLVIIFGAFFFLIALVGNVMRVFRTFNRNARESRQSFDGGGHQQSASASHPNSRKRRAQKGKIFDSDEGEYVNFVEVKE